MTRREHTHHVIRAFEMLIAHYRDRHPINWTVVPLEVQTEVMFLANRLAASVFIQDCWYGPMSDQQRVEFARLLEEEVESIAFLNSVFA